jgi:hypothetical protein
VLSKQRKNVLNDNNSIKQNVCVLLFCNYNTPKMLKNLNPGDIVSSENCGLRDRPPEHVPLFSE